VLDVLSDKMKERVAINKKILDDSIASGEQSAILPEIQVPTLLLWGAKDNVLHVQNVEVFQSRLKSCNTIIIQGVGHVPMIEQPKRVAGYIGKFVRELSHKEQI
jgi:abhydrolase domain-containing protein 6